MLKFNMKKGFTLTELLITVAIIGILTAVALPRYTQTEAARISEAISQLNAIRLGEEQYKTDAGTYFPCMDGDQTGCWEIINVEDPEAPTNHLFNYEVSTDAPDNTEFCAIASRLGSGKTVCIDNLGTYYGSHTNGPGYKTAIVGTPCADVATCYPT